MMADLIKAAEANAAYWAEECRRLETDLDIAYTELSLAEGRIDALEDVQEAIKGCPQLDLLAALNAKTTTEAKHG